MEQCTPWLQWCVSGGLPVVLLLIRSCAAISTVLNHPHKRQAPPKAHSTLPAVPPADLPRVRRKDFDSYLRAIGPEWERYERNRQLGRDGQAQLDHDLSTPRASLSSAIDISHASPHTSVHAKVIPPLDSVPPIFFDPKFDLGDPRTYGIVTQNDPLSLPSTSANGDIAEDSPLLDRLSQYADTVEQHLVKEISLRSTSFFAALTNLQDLQAESEQCLDRIARMRQLLQEVDEQGAKRGLEIVRLESKLINVNRVQDGVKTLSGVVEMAGVAKGLADAGQWGQALDVIEELERLWDSSEGVKAEVGPNVVQVKPKQNGIHRLSSLPPMAEEDEEVNGEKQLLPLKAKQNIRLSSLRAFASLPTHLQQLTLGIATSLSSEVVGALRIDLGERISGRHLDPNTVDQNLRDCLMPLLHGLVRTNGLKEATLTWGEVVLGEIKGIIKAVCVLLLP
jgi:vacuolar protein sorting-associated protein 54